ncbi:hypothetical protein [Actinotalea solisilvae]|uniref:hypothetical protein n=1 Tax=Actinotalea solisilvae TaxID=2072922 RepID=UPI0018F174FD|nr:hypothetical protein [Actinotalea solisilvae]
MLIALSVTMSLVPTGSASAAEGHAAAVDETVAAVAPDVDVLEPVRGVDGRLAAAESVTSVPALGDGDLLVANGALDQAAAQKALDVPDVVLSLPDEAQVADSAAVVTESGTVVYAGEASVDVAVQATQSGVRVQTVIADSTAPTQYTYAFEGSTPVLNADGSVDLVVAVDDNLTATVGHLDVPWAFDAAGAPVATFYRVEGSSVVQVVDLSSVGSYPVVADPNISSSCVWYGMCFIKFNRSYTNNIAAGTGIAGIVAGLTAVSGGILAPLAAVVGAKLGIDAIFAGWVLNRGNCMGYQFPVTNWLQPLTWGAYEVKRGQYNCA